MEEVFGAGDVTLALLLGLFLGWPLIGWGLLLGFLFLGLMVIPIVCVIYFSRNSNQRLKIYIPIGLPFILSAIVIIYFPTWVLSQFPW